MDEKSKNLIPPTSEHQGWNVGEGVTGTLNNLIEPPTWHD